MAPKSRGHVVPLLHFNCQHRPAQTSGNLLDGCLPRILREDYPEGVALQAVDRTKHSFRTWLKDTQLQEKLRQTGVESLTEQAETQQRCGHECTPCHVHVRRKSFCCARIPPGTKEGGTVLTVARRPERF